MICSEEGVVHKNKVTATCNTIPVKVHGLADELLRDQAWKSMQQRGGALQEAYITPLVPHAQMVLHLSDMQRQGFSN